MSDKLEIGDVYRHKDGGGLWKVISHEKRLVFLKVSSKGYKPKGSVYPITSPYHSTMRKWGDRVYPFKEYYNLTKK